MSYKMKVLVVKSRRRRRSRLTDLDYAAGVTIRYAFPDDAPAIERLAALDSQPPPSGAMLVAEVGGELWTAATVTDDPIAIADPFRPTAELAQLLRQHARRLAAAETPGSERRAQRRLRMQAAG
jgi:hypothetical protein